MFILFSSGVPVKETSLILTNGKLFSISSTNKASISAKVTSVVCSNKKFLTTDRDWETV